MSEHAHDRDREDVGPGFIEATEYSIRQGIQGYLFGLVLAVAQIGVHLVYFLHLTSAPDNTNNILALAFGILIVGLIMVGSLWIMYTLNIRMMPQEMMQMGR